MEENMSCLAEVDSIISLNKKRKSQAETPEMPLPKHICWDQSRFEHDSASDLTTESKNVEIDVMTRGESDPESSKDSNILHGDSDSFMSPFSERYASEASSNMDPYSLDSRSLTKSRCNKTESESLSEELDYSSYNYEEESIMGFGSGLSGYKNDDLQRFTDDDPENILYSNGVIDSNFVLSSDTQQGAKKLTIDKEFEQYFSTLML